MNLLKLKEYTEERVVYLYQPEGKGEWGEIVYAFADGEAKLLKPAEESNPLYFNKALLKVEECANAKALPRDFVQAWV